MTWRKHMGRCLYTDLQWPLWYILRSTDNKRKKEKCDYIWLNSKKHSKVPLTSQQNGREHLQTPIWRVVSFQNLSGTKTLKRKQTQEYCLKMSKRPMFSQGEMKMAKSIKKCSASLIIRQMQIKLNGVTPHTCWNSYCYQRGNTWQAWAKIGRKGTYIFGEDLIRIATIERMGFPWNTRSGAAIVVFLHMIRTPLNFQHTNLCAEETSSKHRLWQK